MYRITEFEYVKNCTTWLMKEMVMQQPWALSIC